MKHYYDVKSADSRSRLTRDKLVAVTTTDVPAISLLEGDLLGAIETPLLLASFAARQRTMTPAWTASDCVHHVAYFVGNISRPPQVSESEGVRDHVVDRKEFPRFIRRSLSVYLRLDSGSRELLRQAIFKVLPDPDRTIESHYLTLFSALESLVLLFRRKYDFEFTVANKMKWKDFRRSVASLAKKHPSLTNSARRGMVIDMIGVLRRVPLGIAYSAYCKHFKVDMSDLWSAFGSKGSLNEIRNKLSHGDSFPETHYRALMYASLNLERTVERMLLAILRWPIENSNVSRHGIEVYDGITNRRFDRYVNELMGEVSASKHLEDSEND